MPLKRPFPFPPTLTPANWLSPRIRVSAGRTLYLGTRAINGGMVVRTTCTTRSVPRVGFVYSTFNVLHIHTLSAIYAHARTRHALLTHVPMVSNTCSIICNYVETMEARFSRCTCGHGCIMRSRHGGRTSYHPVTALPTVAGTRTVTGAAGFIPVGSMAYRVGKWLCPPAYTHDAGTFCAYLENCISRTNEQTPTGAGTGTGTRPTVDGTCE